MLSRLVEAVARATEGPQAHVGIPTPVECLTLLRSDHERSPNLVIYRPALCVVLQGRKRTAFGALDYELGAGEAVLVGISTPGIGRVIEASPDEPYLGLVIEFDLAIFREVLEEIAPPVSDDAPQTGIFALPFEGAVADCALRMVNLLDTPQAIPLLTPAIMRELAYWLLTGPYGGEICRLMPLAGPTRALLDSLRLLRERYTEPIRIEDLARAAHMSPSVFHLRFKALTATTPLQYQKQLRLHEARRLLMAGEANVEAAAFRVGYASPSQFNREYSRTFGMSPKRDATALRAG